VLDGIGAYTVSNVIVNKFPLNLYVIDIAIGPNTVLYAVSYDRILSSFNRITGQFTQLVFNMNVYKVAVSSSGRVYFISDHGTTYYFDEDLIPVLLPGCANDIGVGSNDQVYRIGCDMSDEGFEAYKLSCPPTQASTSQSTNTCNWVDLNGSGVAIDVLKNGNPVMVNGNGEILFMENNSWYSLLGMEGKDVSVSSEGIVFFAGLDNMIYSIDYFQKIPVLTNYGITGVTTSVGPFSTPFVIDTDGQLYQTSASE